MPTVQLNGRTAPSQACPPGAEEITFWSAELPRFGQRIRKSGARSWVLQFRPKGGQLTKLTLGDPRTVPFVRAVREASRLLATIKLGGDPVGEVLRTRSAVTVGEMVTRYLAYQKPRMKPRSNQELKRHLETHAKLLHGRQASQVTQREVVELLEGIAAMAPITANRVRSSLSAMFAWGMKAGLVRVNPIAMTFKPGEEKPRERVLTDPELALIWAVTDGAADHDRIVRLLMLTGARREEIAGMRRSEITVSGDGKAAWVLPSERIKNPLPLELDLPLPVASLLPEPRRNADGEVRSSCLARVSGGFPDGRTVSGCWIIASLWPMTVRQFRRGGYTTYAAPSLQG